MKLPAAAFILYAFLAVSSLFSADGATASEQAISDPSAAIDSPFQTNARSGVYPQDKRFWFSVDAESRIRISVNGNETYKGPGPASISLSAKSGESKIYEVVAERRSSPPENALLESRNFSIVIDTEVPAVPQIKGEQIEGSSPMWMIRFSAPPDAWVEAVIDSDSSVQLRKPTGNEVLVPGKRIKGIAWTADAAGNRSVPVSFAFEPFSMLLANPVPGTWANRQSLIVLSEGASSIFWTDDGSDPLGPSGKEYRTPVLVDRVGQVTVRAAARSPDGRIARDEATYTVSHSSGTAVSELALLRSAELSGHEEKNRVILVPEGWFWDIGRAGESLVSAIGTPAFKGGRQVTLRSVEGLSRVVPFFVSDGKGLSRFAFLLDGGGRRLPSVMEPVIGPDTPNAPKEFTAGVARVLQWSGLHIRYRWKGVKEWLDLSGPLMLPPEGGMLEWVVDRGNTWEGPYETLVKPALPESVFSSGFPLLSQGSGNSLEGIAVAGPVRIDVPPGLPGVRFSLSSDFGSGYQDETGNAHTAYFELAAESSVLVDLCDGEQNVWRLGTANETEPFLFTVDRRPPQPPVLNAPPAGSWLRSVPAVDAVSEDAMVIAKVSWKLPDGTGGQRPYVPGTPLPRFTSSSVVYGIEAWTEDEAGNKSVVVSRSFTVDESTIYVSAELENPNSAVSEGSRARPLSSLSQAIELARKENRSRIQIAGSAELGSRVQVYDGLIIEGGYDLAWQKSSGKSSVRVLPGSGLVSEGGSARISDMDFIGTLSETAPFIELSSADLSLESCSFTFMGKGVSVVPLIRLSENTRLTVGDCIFSSTVPVLDLRSSTLLVSEGLLALAGFSGERAVAITARNSDIRFRNSRISVKKMEGGKAIPRIGISIEAQGGKISLERSLLEAVASDSATGLALRGTSVSAVDSEVHASASRYAAAVSSDASGFAWTGGELNASGRDAVALLLESSLSAGFLKAAFRVNGTGVVRGIQFRGLSPELEDCSIFAEGGSRGAEAFAGDEPGINTLRGNSLYGFDYLLAGKFRTDDLQSFNKRFASPTRPNVLKKPVVGN